MKREAARLVELAAAQAPAQAVAMDYSDVGRSGERLDLRRP